MTRIIVRSLLSIAVVTSMAFGSTSAYFSDVKIIPSTFSTGSWASAKVVINEVYYIGNQEWIELYNAGNDKADIKGWSICNSLQDCGKLNPAKKTEIEPGGYVLLSHSANDIKNWDVAKEITKIYYAGSKIDFDDEGDLVLLKDKNGNTADQISYGNNTEAFNPSCPLVETGNSLYRVVAGADTETAADFAKQPEPSPGY